MNTLFPAGLLAFSLIGVSCHRTPEAPHVSGTIETDETHVASRYGGRVERVMASEGGFLTNGQPIVELEATELHARRAGAAAQLAELEAGPRPQEITAARNDWEAQAAELELARSDAKRAQEVFAEKAISNTAMDRAASRAATLEKSAAAAKSRYDLLQAGTRPERIEQTRAPLGGV